MPRDTHARPCRISPVSFLSIYERSSGALVSRCEIYNALIKFLSDRLSRLIRPAASLARNLLYDAASCAIEDRLRDNEANNILGVTPARERL